MVGGWKDGLSEQGRIKGGSENGSGRQRKKGQMMEEGSYGEE